MSVFGWHCAFSQLVCLQWMPYDDGFSHLCSTASDIAITYVCSSPPAKPFQGKAMSVGNEHRPDSCNQCFAWVALPPNSSEGAQLTLPLDWQSLCKPRQHPKGNNLLAKNSFVGRTLFGGTWWSICVTQEWHLIWLNQHKLRAESCHQRVKGRKSETRTKISGQVDFVFSWKSLSSSLSVSVKLGTPTLLSPYQNKQLYRNLDQAGKSHQQYPVAALCDTIVCAPPVARKNCAWGRQW